MSISSLLRIAIIELDTNEECRVVWNFPSLSQEETSLLISKSGLRERGAILNLSKDVPDFTCGRFRDWQHYIISLRCTSDHLPKVTAISLVLLADDFSPEKYRKLGESLILAYMKGDSPSYLVQSLLQLVIEGETKLPSSNEKLSLASLDRNATPSRIGSMLQQFGANSIILYTGVVLRTRIMIVANSQETSKDDLLSIIISLLSFLPSGSKPSPVYSFLASSDHADFTEMISQSSFIGATFDHKVATSTDGYDLLINYEKSTVTIAESSKDIFALGKLHKDISKKLSEMAEMEEDEQIIEAIQLKTQEILRQLESLAAPNDASDRSAPRSDLSRTALAALGLAPATENFLFRLAQTQKLVA